MLSYRGVLVGGGLFSRSAVAYFFQQEWSAAVYFFQQQETS